MYHRTRKLENKCLGIVPALYKVCRGSGSKAHQLSTVIGNNVSLTNQNRHQCMSPAVCIRRNARESKVVLCVALLLCGERDNFQMGQWNAMRYCEELFMAACLYLFDSSNISVNYHLTGRCRIRLNNNRNIVFVKILLEMYALWECGWNKMKCSRAFMTRIS